MTIGDKPRAITEYELSLKLLDGDPRVTPDQRASRRQYGEAQLAKLRAP